MKTSRDASARLYKGANLATYLCEKGREKMEFVELCVLQNYPRKFVYKIP